MKSEPSPEMTRFNNALRQVMQVSKRDLDKMLADEKAAKSGKVKPGPKPKSSSSDHAADESD